MPKSLEPNFFLTTAIDYVNSLPHLGTAYEKIGADILARFHRMKGEEVLFQMGNDEHSVNVKKAAEASKLSPKEYCDRMRPRFESAWEKLTLSYDQFIQTSDPAHHKAVKKFFESIFSAGDIYEGDYEGLYCESCEAFYTEKDLVEGLCPQHKSRPRQLKERNFFFKLSKYAPELLAHIEKNPQFILPEIRRNEIVNVIKGGLKDISVSRSGFDWGIPVPSHPKHVVYVWFDALINYLTLIGYTDDPKKFSKWWPADCHIIGKDITRFHCVIWPAMLLSARLPLPRTVFGHGFVYLKGEKMSKSLGNVVTPLDVADLYGADPLRYYLVRSAPFGDDSNFTWDDFINRYNSDLANGIGNLASRTAGMIDRYFSGKLAPVPLTDTDKLLTERFPKTLEQISRHLDPWQSGDLFFNRALETIWEWISAIDTYIDREAPWKLAKEKNEARLSQVLSAVAESLFQITLLLKPFLPTTAEKIWRLFGWNAPSNFEKADFSTPWDPAVPIVVDKGVGPLFPRIEAKS